METHSETQAGFKLDKWQRAVMETKGNITIRAGRQVGKSTVVAMKAAQFAIENPDTVTMVIAASQRQSSLLFEKIRAEIDDLERQKKIKHAEKPTLTRIVLDNGSKIYSLPAGRTGWFIRGFTLDLLICDEAAYIPEEVWKAVVPMIAVSQKLRRKGWIILLSTPFGKGGYFFHSFTDKDFRQFHISSENCPRIPASFLTKERARLTKAEYAQEYKGEFIDEWNQFFPTALIKECMTFLDWSYEEDYHPGGMYYLGVDFARYGGSENAFVIAEMDRKKKVKVIKALTTDRVSITDTVGRIKLLDDKFKFRKIFIDDGGVGGGASDFLKEDLGRKIVELNNARRSLDRYDDKTSRILKEDMYSGALVLMEAGRVEMLSDLSLLKSLKSVIYEYGSDTRRVKIYGDYAHLAEAFVRVCWCVRKQGLKVFIA